MSKPAFTERDVQKAVAGATKAGFVVGCVEIDRHTGRITLLPPGAAPEQGDDLKAELEAWRGERDEG